MKRIIISLLTLVALIAVTLPVGIPVAMGAGGNQTATNETVIIETDASPLVADFDFSVCYFCSLSAHIKVTFTDESSGGAKPYKSWYWDFGDGSNSTRQKPKYYYTSYGAYNVTLTVTDRADNVASKTETVTIGAATNIKSVELDSGVLVLPAANTSVAAPSAWPTAWTGLDTDDDGRCETFRNVFDTDGDGYALYYVVDSDYIYLRMETMGSPGWPNTGSQGVSRYKWWFNTGGKAAYVHGTTVEDAEFLLILEDRTDTSDVDGSRDLLGELTFMDDLTNIGFAKRWNKGGSGAYITGTPDNGDPSSLWKRELGDGTAGTGGPQEVMIGEIGYRIDDAATGGYFVDMYVSRAALGNPSSLCIIWATDNQNPNLDQAPNCDRPEETYCIMLGKDYGDAPDPTYPTLLASDGARHDVGELYLGADIDAELDGQPNSDATGDDDSYIDDEDGVVFTALIKGQSADVAVTASDAGYLDAWVDFNADGDWGDGGEQIFISESLSAGPNDLSFDVPFSATAGQTFARFRFSSAGGLSYDGLADDGEVEDYMVEIEGCTLTVNLTGDTSFCEGSNTTITAIVTGGTPDYIYDWSASTAPGTDNLDGTFTAIDSGTVEVTVTDANNCTGTDSVTVTVNENPEASADNNGPVCEGATLTLTGGPDGMDTYAWTGPNSFTSSEQSPTVSTDATTAMAGEYTLTVTNSNGCSDEAST
ncbi:MAG: PKD domain-containing protein, partial [Dehalococcoidia bacterium]